MHFRYKLKNAKGITLIALVITIVVLILLATVTINIALNNDGILKHTTTAKNMTQVAMEKEKLMLLSMSSLDQRGRMNIDKLKTNVGESSEEMTDNGATEFPLEVTYIQTGNKYFIFDDGSVAVYDAEAVARIGDKLYTTLQGAIDTVPFDNVEKEVILLKNVSEDVSVLENQNVKLNLNSKTVSATDNENRDCVISTRGKLTITGDGTVTGKPIAVRCIYTGNLRIINGTYEGTTNSVRKTDDDSNVTIDGGTYTAQVPMRCWGKNDFIINGGTFEGIDNAIRVGDDVNLTINGGNFHAETNSALHLDNSANVKINKGIFNSGRTNDLGDGVLHHYGTGTLTIGNVGDNNSNILINSNESNTITGIIMSQGNANVIINSGTIHGYNGVNMLANNTSLYLNGGEIIATGGTVANDSGWSVNFTGGSMTNVNVYMKRNANIMLSGRGKTGKQSIYWTKYVTDVD